jgi:hypothetical protein
MKSHGKKPAMRFSGGQRYARPYLKTAIELAETIQKTTNALRQFVVLPHDSVSTLIALWIAGTYMYRLFDYFPYLSIQSQTPRCGKTKLLELIGLLSQGQPQPFATITVSTLCLSDGTVLFDDADYLSNPGASYSREVCTILNAGNQKRAVVPRIGKGTSGEVTYYEVYGPKAFAGLTELPPTLSDRCFHIHLEQSAHRTPRLHQKEWKEEFKGLQTSFTDWASQSSAQVKNMYHQLPLHQEALQGYDARFQDIAEPLLVLAMCADQTSNGPSIVHQLIEAFRIVGAYRQNATGGDAC